MKSRHHGNSFNETLRLQLAIDIERDQWKKLEGFMSENPQLAGNAAALSRGAGVPIYIARRFSLSLKLKEKQKDVELEKRVTALALLPENQNDYAGPDRINPAYWLKHSNMCATAEGFRYGNAKKTTYVINFLRRNADDILNKIIDAVFANAYAPENVALFNAEKPEAYYSAVAKASHTRPQTVQYVLEVMFKMPALNVIAELAKKYGKNNMSLHIAAETVRMINRRHFAGRGFDVEVTGLAKHLHEQGIGQPMEVAAGLVKVWQESKK